MHSYEVKNFEKAAIARVLILVLMEDALVHGYTGMKKKIGSVLILVLMEDALVQSGRRSKSLKGQRVLILVLMEDALVHGGRL